MSFDIRLAKEDDSAAISRLNSVVQAKHVAAVPWLFKDTELEHESVSALMERADTVMYVAVWRGSVTGYVYAQARSHPETPLTFPYLAVHIHHICVDHECRRQGIGRALIEAIRAAAKDMNAKRLTADVWDFNEAAKRLFQNSELSPFQLRLWQVLDG